MLIALLAAASLQATAQTEGNDTSFPNVVTDSVIPIKQTLSPLSSDSLLPSITDHGVGSSDHFQEPVILIMIQWIMGSVLLIIFEVSE